jgi:hypothetical protein
MGTMRVGEMLLQKIAQQTTKSNISISAPSHA